MRKTSTRTAAARTLDIPAEALWAYVPAGSSPAVLQAAEHLHTLPGIAVVADAAHLQLCDCVLLSADTPEATLREALAAALPAVLPAGMPLPAGMQAWGTAYDMLEERGSAFPYVAEDAWHVFAAAVRLRETFGYIYDWGNICKRVREVAKANDNPAAPTAADKKTKTSKTKA